MQMNCNKGEIKLKRKLLMLLSIMVLITIISTIMIKSLPHSTTETKPEKDTIKVVTTFYPVYMIGLNIADQIDGIEVNSLTDLNTGCLHDYQLTTADMKLVSSADVLIVNGGGMEAFLEDIISNYPNITIINSSEGITMIENDGNEHTATVHEVHAEDVHVEEGNIEEGNIEEEYAEDVKAEDMHVEDANSDKVYGEEGYAEDVHDEKDNISDRYTDVGKTKDENTETELDVDVHVDENQGGKNYADEKHSEEVHAEDEHEHTHSHGEFNSHIWLNPKLYSKQIENIKNGMINFINHKEFENEDKRSQLIKELDQNAQNYIKTVNQLDSEYQNVIDNLTVQSEWNISQKQAVIFHDAFAYLAQRVGIPVAFTVPLDSDTSLSAGDIAAIIDSVKMDHIEYLFTEEQYSDSIARQIEAETGAKVYIIDSVVTGDGSKDSYIKAMQNNLEVVKQAMK